MLLLHMLVALTIVVPDTALDNFSYGSLYQKNGKDKSGDELYMSIDNEVFKEHRVTSYDTEDAMKRIDELGLN